MTDVPARVLEGRPRDLGGFSVRRVLPAGRLQTVGPFIFFDHMGPATFSGGGGVDVRPHPHIGLATVTYLFAGEFMHRDSLGTAQLIRPGDVNWMVAGRGIVHSERTPPEARNVAGGATIHGIQTWIALPQEHEEITPSFEHHPAATLPEFHASGVSMRLIAGSAYGRQAPTSVFSPMFYLAVELEPDATLELPDEHAERALYVVEGEIEVAGGTHTAGCMLLFEEGAPGEALSGFTENSAKGVQREIGIQLMFYVPAIGSDEQIRLLGWSESLIGASEVP